MNRSTTSSENGLVLFAKIKAIEGKLNELQITLEDLITPTLAEKELNIMSYTSEKKTSIFVEKH